MSDGSVSPTLDDVLELANRLSNWGRWGDEDQIGTLNLITPEHRIAAVSDVRSGEVFSLAVPFDSEGPQVGGAGRFNPMHVMLRGGAVGEIRFTDDMIIMPLQCSTQWDGLAHVFHRDRMYNGHGPEDVSSAVGARKNGIEHAADRIIGRGVLLDIPFARGVLSLDPGEAISAADLDDAATRQRVEVREGDIVLVRTGQLAQVRARRAWGDYELGDAPGLGLDTLEWIASHGIAAVATDTYAAEVRPAQTPDVAYPVHLVAIAYMGLTLGEIFDLEALAASCADDGRYSFLFSAAPLPITGAVGSPINPLALK
jgi:kynurenine formamidase